jgi:hypothetical protein
MTWVVAANAFNGVVCVADVQMTVPYVDRSRTPKYFNCLRKVHQLWRNAYVAFSEDVRMGLLLIADLKELLAQQLGEDEFFSLEDGNLEIIQRFLRDRYAAHAGGKLPKLQLMLVWYYQEGDEAEWRTGCMRFIAPDFRFNSSGLLQVDQCGSGMHGKAFQALTEFLKGRPVEDAALFERMFGSSEVPNVMTVKKMRNLLVREAGQEAFSGVSRSYMSVMAETNFAGLWKAEQHDMLVQLLKKAGMEERRDRTRADQLITHAFDIEAINQRVDAMKALYPQQYAQMQRDFAALYAAADPTALTKPPTFVEMVHLSEEEPLHADPLCATWEQVQAFMQRQGLPAAAAAAAIA